MKSPSSQILRAGPSVCHQEWRASVAEFVEIRYDVVVLQQLDLCRPLGEVADERSLRERTARTPVTMARRRTLVLASRGACRDRSGRRAGRPQARRTQKHPDAMRRRWMDGLDFEETAAVSSTPARLRVGEIRADGLRVEVESGTAELLVPICRLVMSMASRSGWRYGRGDNQRVLAARAIEAGFVQFREKGPDVGG